jgi:hypothetical protein
MAAIQKTSPHNAGLGNTVERRFLAFGRIVISIQIIPGLRRRLLLVTPDCDGSKTAAARRYSIMIRAF